MVSATVVDVVLAAVVTLGAPVLVALFYAEGLVVGKLLQPPAVFVAYLALVEPATAVLVAVAVGCVVAATLGQWTLYRGFDEDAPEFFGLRRRVPFLADFPARVERRVGERRLRFVDRAVAGYGVVGICLLNLVPGIRGLSAVPAGLGDYPRGRFLAASTAGNAGYVAGLVAVALGLARLVEALV